MEIYMADTASGACVGEWDGRREPMGESDREQYCIGRWHNVDGGEKWHIRFAIDVTLHLTVE